MSSLYFQRSQSKEAVVHDFEELGSHHPSNLSSILAAAGAQLPLLPPENLSFDKQLGKGSTFEVSRQIYERPSEKGWLPYYVAVKHIIADGSTTNQLERRYDSVMRELRVLT